MLVQGQAQVKDRYLRPLDEDYAEYDPVQLYQELAGRMTQADYADSLGVAYWTFRLWWDKPSDRSKIKRVYRRLAAQMRKSYQERGWLSHT